MSSEKKLFLKQEGIKSTYTSTFEISDKIFFLAFIYCFLLYAASSYSCMM